MTRCVVLNVVGLCEALLGEHSPAIVRFLKNGRLTRIEPPFPAVTCTAQSNYLTGVTPSQHGIVGNGWYNRELAEVQFWKQSNHLVQNRKLWEDLRQTQPDFTCANTFWWYNMYSTVDWSITPRPMYPADGRKVFDIYTHPSSIRHDIKNDLGEFPFPSFWGPAAGLETPQGKADAVSRWIAEAAKWIEERHRPDLHLVYLPHLDYNLQRYGPNDPRIHESIRAIDEIVGGLLSYFNGRSVEVVLLSEYGIVAVDRPVHLNRLFRQHGWIAIREELGLEILDCGASAAFAVADHQIAHIYVKDPGLLPRVRGVLEATQGVSAVLDASAKRTLGLDHARAGDLVAVAEPKAWFTYYYWENDRLAPDFSRTVDIHRKPGYDPVELFLDPALRSPKARIALRLLQKKMGFRMLMDVIPLDASLVRGSHGSRPADPTFHPLLITSSKRRPELPEIDSSSVYTFLRNLLMT